MISVKTKTSLAIFTAACILLTTIIPGIVAFAEGGLLASTDVTITENINEEGPFMKEESVPVT